MSYIPEQGDIVWLNFDPSSGKETIKHRPAYVISRKLLNQHIGLAIVALITSTVCGIKLEVVLDAKQQTQGAILVHQLKALDFAEREAEFIETSPQQVIDAVKMRVKLITD